jgi:hypothetical protein
MPRLYPAEKHQLLTNRALPHGWHCTDKQRARTTVKRKNLQFSGDASQRVTLFLLSFIRLH